ncbi:MAG: hypothetical protein K2Y17_02525 [Qipengyuania sp.]|nr:hypothetical protein [Qipengyuania sp.]
MNTLGDLLAAARGSAGGFQAWLHRFEPELAIQVEQAAGQTRLSPTGYVRAAIADFSRLASEEDWATLMSSLRDSEDPGMVCLRAMVDWRLTAHACHAHSHHAAAD